MRILLVAALLVIAAIGGCDGDNGDKSSLTPQSGWDIFECSQAKNTLADLKKACTYNKAGACEAVAQLQKDINDNCH